ncbi:diacylglycerol kinase [Thiohalobacter sp. IOR34]|uniref:diacylglycerol kinase n=1 Tax=Thiohalobacter sp. IOR34 TaxID=3057176 RepID=UPI0025B177A7|nr:diacylglycerol kinase [Thiohalobacter sp. IOR34]WJW75883.1 diacylglycerol kinase [Thiohalobacter sp. IOR34]
MGKPAGNTGLRRLVNASRFSWLGLRAAWRHEAAFRQELAASLLLVPLALWLGEDGVEKALLLGSWLLVPLVELLNSALEAALDRIGEAQHELAGRAKDMGSAAVLVALVDAAAVWALVLI